MRRKSTNRKTSVRHGAFAAALLAMSAYADDPPPNQTTAAAQSAYSNKLICKREHVTGSMIPKKVCRTQEQIDKQQEEMRAYADEMRRNSAWSTVNPDH